MNKNSVKGLGAIVAGFIAVLVLSIGTDAVLEKLALFPPQNEPGAYLGWMLLLALVYRSVYAVVGGYVTAALAPDRRMRHATILGSIGLVFAILGSIANADKSTASTAWYPIALVLLTLPSVWLGGKLKSSQYRA